MCDVCRALASFISFFQGKSVGQLFSNVHVTAPFKWENVVPGACLHCNRPMSLAERYPAGVTPRCFCQNCYSQLITNSVNQYCIVSGEVLPADYIQQQQWNPRELQFKIAPGGAWDYFILAANKALGTDVGFLAGEGYGQSQSQNNPGQHQQQQIPAPVDWVDADFTDVAIPRQIENKPIQVGYTPQESFEDFMNNESQNKNDEPVFIPVKRGSYGW